MCEAYCPTDALYVHPQSTPLETADAIENDHIGRYREKLGWGKGKGARIADCGGSRGAPSSHDLTRILTAVSLCSIRVVNPSEINSSS